MSSSKKIDLLRGFAARNYLYEEQTPKPPSPLHIVYVYTVYSTSSHRVG
jgi:hypothetical protein